MFLLKVLLLFLVLKVFWVVAGFLLVGLFWGAVFLIIAARSMREKIARNQRL